MYSCTMPVPYPGLPIPKKAISVLNNRALYDIVSKYGNGLGLVEVEVFLGGLGCCWVVWGFQWTARPLC